MNNNKFNVGDKVYYVEKETDSEVEAYIYKDMGDDVYMVKLREGTNFGFFPSYRLTKIDPPTWESLEENLKRNNMEMDEDDEKENV